MIKSSSESSTDNENEDPNRSFENPNYRKLYAALSMTAMMGGEQMDQDCHGDGHRQENNVNDQNDSQEQATNCNRKPLPEGWERHEDDNGPYYWHIPSGTIQREVPKMTEEEEERRRNSIMEYYHVDAEGATSSDNKIDEDAGLTFTVHSLGWMDFDEQKLTTTDSSKELQRCIIELTTRGDAVRCWGKQQTQQLNLTIDNSTLKLQDPTSKTLLIKQAISGIRVWGVNDNNDFAYVAKDSSSSLSVSNTQNSPGQVCYKCFVFHCEDPEDGAQQIANILKDEMIKIKKGTESASSSTKKTERPKQLFLYDQQTPSAHSTPTALEFPTPIEEPRKTIVAKYLGMTEVNKPFGIEVLNEAIDKLVQMCETKDEDEVPELSSPLLQKNNIPVLVHVSPSNIIIESSSSGECFAECRVRYLSFLAISSQSVKRCGFIMQVGEKQFEAHCFECEPSSGALCKTIEAACKLRFQKCLDAHKQRCSEDDAKTSTNKSVIKSAIKSVFSKIRMK